MFIFSHTLFIKAVDDTFTTHTIIHSDLEAVFGNAHWSILHIFVCLQLHLIFADMPQFIVAKQ